MAMAAGSHGRRMARGGDGRRLVSEINVTPLVDVMLVLLIIFMVTAPMLTAGITVDLPETEAAPLSGNDEPLSVTIRADGKVYIQDTPVVLDSLGPKLQAIAGAKKRDLRIVVRGDKRIDYGQVMKVVGTISASGFTKIALLTDVES